jgi:hypothetical protein
MEFSHPFSYVGLWGFILVLSAVTALMEIQIEGGNGWAGCLPSWRFAPAWMRNFLNGKDLTGYHLYLNLHMLVLFHFPMFFVEWSLFLELTILSIFFACMIVEDFLWFVLNPHFGWTSFGKGKVSWYTQWFGGFPVDYYLWLIVSAMCAFVRGGLREATGSPSLMGFTFPVQHVLGWLTGLFCVVVALIAVIAIVTPRIVRFLSKDTLPHPGHPGICNACAMDLPKNVVQAFSKPSSQSKK